MRANVIVKDLILNDGTVVPLPENGIVLIVGPNNAGKSQVLRDVAKLVASNGDKGVVVVKADVDYRGTSDELKATFEEDHSILRSQTAGDRIDLGAGGMQSLGSVMSWWGSAVAGIVGQYFVLFADTESRLHASKPAPSLNLYESEPVHALHYLYARRDVEKRLDKISREAFAKGLILDTWAGGDHWALRVGEIEPPGDPRPPQEYLDVLRKLPLLHEQGDGVRSMIGLLLSLLTGHQTVALIDEPEAFLHPPQARYFAKILSDGSAESSTTAFLSTHSSDIVHGTLEGPAQTTVIRLVRRGDINHASVLDNAAVRRLWSDPLLRYSNLLEGLFTDAVVVCESDADCKFFASMRDTLEPEEDGARRPDLLFTSCGGKHRMHVAVEALRASSVPVAVIGDFDVLNDWAVLSRLIQAAGGDAKEFEADWRILNAALTSGSRTPSVAGMKAAVDAAFEGVAQVTPRALEPVRTALKIENGWDRVKNSGLSSVPKGDPYSAAERLVKGLTANGIHLIPVGEMEDFVPSVGGHGPGWLADVLEKRLHESPATDGARQFFESVLDSFE